MYEVEIYKDKNGKSKIEEYLNKLQEKSSKDSKIKINKIVSYIRLLKELGLQLGQPYIKHIDEQIWELRPLKDRILFASLYNNKFILLSIFIKNTQKTPKKEIEKAKILLNDYIKRSDN